ncbi:hypothetical protein GYH30_037908 [Glycine max]|uniref:Uncharacterized protein n=1 Tax=Glycine max TaxID=3847 RepID=A0A0R0GWE2_SOYBN|nr:hypothetical protein GYH30_037908 [Glycine max]
MMRRAYTEPFLLLVMFPFIRPGSSEGNNAIDLDVTTDKCQRPLYFPAHKLWLWLFLPPTSLILINSSSLVCFSLLLHYSIIYDHSCAHMVASSFKLKGTFLFWFLLSILCKVLIN